MDLTIQVSKHLNWATAQHRQ